jgi:hypothetical protein
MIRNNPIIKMSIDIVICNESPIEIKKNNKNNALTNVKGNTQNIEMIFQNLNMANMGINKETENNIKNKFLKIRSETNKF